MSMMSSPWWLLSILFASVVSSSNIAPYILLANNTHDLDSMDVKNAVHDGYDSTTGDDRELQTRIVGGTSVDPQRYPYFAYLNVVTDKGFFRCGGTLVAPNVIMSAAHCYQDFIEGGYEILGIKAWVNMTSTLERNEYEYSRIASKVLLHPAYERRGTKNDVMLLQFDEPIRGIQVPFIASSSTTLSPGDPVSVLGYGFLSESSSLASDLHAVDISVIDYDDCNDSNSYNGLVIPSIMICAGAVGGGKDACFGDSGGPLIVKGDGTPADDVVVGIVSWGAGCARTDKYGVYSKVSAFADFIKRNLCSLSSDPPEYCFQVSSPVTSSSSSPVSPQGGGSTTSAPPSSSPSFIPTIRRTNTPSTSPSHRPTNGPSNVPTQGPSSPPPTTVRSDIPSLYPSTLRPETSATTTEIPLLTPPLNPSDVPSLDQFVSSEQPTLCIDWGSPCQVHSDCCSMNCLETNKVVLGKRCFGPEKGSAPRGGSMGSIRRIGNDRGGAGSGAGGR